ncbi:MAG TPA: hypothetical protein PKJ83_10880 [Cyclobacteriaceae bacterium]|nr:hypothetical protein [Cyclobacteriaceae bacterium]HPW64312.1 hypothetical protein [Cyclobacteriaceae bacterium]HRG80620.1 hypothetical protein [Cyclobacteriaceae bacterium]
MDKLKDNWLTDGLIDFEYKKYQLLAYFKEVKNSFSRVELYPFLSDLVFHYRNLISLKENHSLIRDSFPKELSPEGLKNLEVNYKRMIEDDLIMQEIESIMEYALPQFKASLDEGSYIYEYVESKCEISPVGLTSLYANEGYLFVTQPPEKETHVYRYQATIFEQSTEMMRGIHTRFMLTAERSLSSTYENLKLSLIRQYSELPNPSVYLVLSKLRFPFDQTLMPVAKRLLVKQISKAA